MDSETLRTFFQGLISNPEGYPAVISAVVGVLAQLLRFVISPTEAEDRIEKKIGVLRDKAAETLRVAIEHGTRVLTGQPETAKNSYINHINEFARVLGVEKDLNTIGFRINTVYTCMLVTSVFSVFLPIISSLWEEARPTIAITGGLLLLAQSAGVYILISQASELKKIKKHA